MTNEMLDRLKQQNRDFGERDHPEFDFWSSGVQEVNPTQGIDLDGLPERAPVDFLEELLAWQPRHPMDKSRATYCNAVSITVAKRPEWGIAWAEILISRALMDADLWYCVCQGWRNASLTPEQWKSVLDMVEKIAAPPEFFASFAEVLENGSRREGNALPDSLMVQAHRVAVRIWEVALERSPIEDNSHKDWLSTAINRPGGKLAEFWLQRISYDRKTAGDAWSGLPPEIQTEITQMLRGNSGAAAHARIVLASQYHYFFSLDATFAQRELLPLFDWKTDELRAQQCWHGFLFWGRWLPGFKDQLLPYFNETIAHNANFAEDIHNNLVHQIAGIALFLIDNPLTNDWLTNALQQLPDDDRVQFAAAINRYIRDIGPSIAEKIWERWLADYWNMRLLNIPKPLLPKEANQMASWALSVGRHFPDAVVLIAKIKPILTFESTPLFYLLDGVKKDIVSTYPNATADMILLFLQSPLHFFHANEHVTNVWQVLCKSSISREKLIKIREALYRFGFDPEEP